MASHGSEFKTKRKAVVSPPPIAASRSNDAVTGPAAIRPPSFSRVPIGPPQTKLAVSEPGDAQEMEAESVADSVLRMEDHEVSRSPIVVALSASGDGGDESGDVGDVVQHGFSGGGQPLDADTRNYMEPRFGTSFSDVRIHADSHASQSSDALSARAFTVGSDIAFKSGEYAPGSSEGKRLLAHELTHVVQQSGAAGRKKIQRYQAGDSGHGGIEEQGLEDAGFSADDASKTYFGNWMRDLSQLPPMALPVINILALGEFGQPVTAEQLGTYVPSEHLDNPEGGGTIEDPEIQKLQYSSAPEDKKKYQDALDKLSPDQRKEYDKEKDFADTGGLAKAMAASGLPDYIERGKFHAKDEFAQAVSKGETDEGRLHLGNGLHAVEDYFSHSNFVEAAIWELNKTGAPVTHLVDRMAKTTLGVGAATVGGMDAKGEPKIITGTYKPGANDWVSRLELLNTEIHHGQLTGAFARGLLKKGGIGLHEVAVKLGAKAAEKSGVSTAVGAAGGLAGAVGGAFSGGFKGLEKGWSAGFGTAVKDAVTGAESGAASGGRSGYVEGKEGTEQLVGAATGGVGTVADLFALGTIEAMIGVLTVLGFVVDKTVLGQLADAIAEEAAKIETAKATKEAPVDPKTGVAGPTHSEVAKDDPDNALFAASAALAQEAVRAIGAEMKALWATMPPGTAPTTGSGTSGAPGAAAPGAAAPGATPPTPQTQDPNQAAGGGSAPGPGRAGPGPDPQPVQDLVDKYVSAPSHDPWWHSIVLAEATKK